MSNKRFYWYRVWFARGGWGFAVPAEINMHQDDLSNRDAVQRHIESWLADTQHPSCVLTSWDFLGRVEPRI